VWQERADRLRREVAALAATGPGVADLHAHLIRLVDREVGSDLACWVTLDPQTLGLSAITSGDARIPAQYEPLLAEAEYAVGEPHRFAALARRHEPAARLSDLTAEERRRSARLNTVWRPLGLDEEIRVLFLDDGVCWGAAGMVRSGWDFSDREVALLLAVAPAVASATRLAVRTEARAGLAGTGPAIVVVGPHGELRALTPAAREWQDRIDEIAPGRFLLMMHLMAAGARTTSAGGFRARVRDARGGWAVLDASPLIGADEDEVAVSVEPVTGEMLIGLLLIAYGLTDREREICREIMAGHSTADIAGHLFISALTVQDHLKSVFAKVGVRSRGELVARLRPVDAAA
jgi:DNA-binding CsgD family transcriptional regulator